MKNAYELAETILKSRPDKNRELKSSDSFASIELYGTSACKKVQDMEFCECFHLENESGTGMITLYHAFLKGYYREHYTIEELSVRFKMSPTVLKIWEFIKYALQLEKTNCNVFYLRLKFIKPPLY